MKIAFKKRISANFSIVVDLCRGNFVQFHKFSKEVSDTDKNLRHEDQF